MSERIAVDRTPLVIAVIFGGVVAISMALLQGPEVALPIVAAAGAMIALFNRKWALYLMLPAMALSPDISMHGVAIELQDLLMIPLVAGWVAHLCVTGQRRGTPLDRLLIAYALVAVVATAWGVHLGTVHLFTVSKYVSSPFHVLKRIEFVLLFLIVADTMETVADVRAMSYVLLVSAIALSAYSVQQFSINQGLAVGPEGAPVHEPGFASMVTVALALGMMRGAAPVGKLVLAVFVLFGLSALPLALGRNYVAATLIILLYVGIKEQRWVFLVVPLVAALAVIVYPHGVIDRISSLQHVLSTDPSAGAVGANASTSLFYRAEAPLYYAILALGHSPLFGFGMGVVPLGAVDSEFAIQMAYTGLIGLGIFLVFGVRLFRVANEAKQAATSPFDAGLAFSYQLAIAGYAIYSVFAASVSATHTGGPFFVIAALAGALRRATLAERAPGAVPAGRAGAMVRAVAGGEARRLVSARFAARRELWLANPLAARRGAP